MIEHLRTLAETAKILGISSKTLMKHVRHGHIEFVSVGTGKTRIARRFTDDMIRAFVARNERQEVAPSPPMPRLTVNGTTLVCFTDIKRPSPRKNKGAQDGR